jgi:IPT/TIG domain
MADTLKPGDSLKPNESITSANGRYTLIYQDDGNLVLYSPNMPIWDSKTWGRPAGVCTMQYDGNLVIYGPNGDYIWDTNTPHSPDSFSRLIVQDDGNVVIYLPDGAPDWASNTAHARGDTMYSGEMLDPDQSIRSQDGRFTLTYRSDGDLVLYGLNMMLWHTGTSGTLAGVCIMQNNGDLVFYDPYWTAAWDSGTGSQQNSGSGLVVQNDGNVVIYRPDGTPVWATNTVQHPIAQGDDMQPEEVLYPGQYITSANGRYTFVYQGSDGNLVLYKSDNIELWDSKTNGRPAGVCMMQADGNLVIYDPNGNALWHSGTASQQNSGSGLWVQDDGNVVIYRPNNTPIWSTDTPAPWISNITPTSGQIGDRVTINGASLHKVDRVQFKSEVAEFTINSPSRITATVPENAVFFLGSRVPIYVKNPTDEARSSEDFTVLATLPPIIQDFTPKTGPIGARVTITGRNLLRVTEVQFSKGVKADIATAAGRTETTIGTWVPKNATDGPITVINRAGDSSKSSSDFNVIFGYSSLLVDNETTDKRPLNVWIFDRNSGQWTNKGSVAYEGNMKISLETGHFHDLVCVDPLLGGCGGRNDPTYVDCKRYYTRDPIPGDKDGPIQKHTVA